MEWGNTWCRETYLFESVKVFMTQRNELSKWTKIVHAKSKIIYISGLIWTQEKMAL